MSLNFMYLYVSSLHITVLLVLFVVGIGDSGPVPASASTHARVCAWDTAMLTATTSCGARHVGLATAL